MGLHVEEDRVPEREYIYIYMCVCVYICTHTYIYIHVTESLCYAVEANTTLWSGYTPIKK